MSYTLQKPYTDKQRADFIVKYNHNQGLRIENIDGNLFALEKDEIIKDGEAIKNPDYELEQSLARKEVFEREFFETSLGWIRRKVSMKDGSTKDFLSDLLLPIKAGLELGQSVEIITYMQPDFTQEYTTEYIISLQERKIATPDFIQECLMQTVADFNGGESDLTTGDEV